MGRRAVASRVNVERGPEGGRGEEVQTGQPLTERKRSRGEGWGEVKMGEREVRRE